MAKCHVPSLPSVVRSYAYAVVVRSYAYAVVVRSYAYADPAPTTQWSAAVLEDT